MNMTDEAKWFAIGAHGSQLRKYTGEMYWYHLEDVCDILRKRASDYVDRYPIALVVAYLHDVLEDTEMPPGVIEDCFGIDVLGAVELLSDPPKEIGNRAKRKAITKGKLARAPGWVQTVKYADILSNYASIKEHDPDFYKVFRYECLELLGVMTAGYQPLRETVIKALWEEA